MPDVQKTTASADAPHNQTHSESGGGSVQRVEAVLKNALASRLANAGEDGPGYLKDHNQGGGPDRVSSNPAGNPGADAMHSQTHSESGGGKQQTGDETYRTHGKPVAEVTEN